MAESVLFVTVDDAGAGPLAAALFNVQAPPALRARSAGTAPAESAWPAVREELTRLGLEDHRPTRVTDEDVDRAYVVVTLGNPEACPIRPRTLYLDWSFPGVDGAMYPTVLGALRHRLERNVAALIEIAVPWIPAPDAGAQH